MTVVALDDTDSRDRGMCTTYVATRVAERLVDAGGTVQRRLLVRLNPAVEHKTRGNAALAVHTDLPADEAFDVARETVEAFAVDADARTSPGVVVADIPPPDPGGTATGDGAALDGGAAPVDRPVIDGEAAPASAEAVVPDGVARFARRALRHRHDLDDALAILDRHGWRHAGYAGDGCAVEGRGRIGALAAVGAPAAFDDWTCERISYRELDRCGTPRDVDPESVFAAADRGYPVVWDTVDRVEGEAVCVPNAPGPILHGIRGDDLDACREVAAGIGSEPVERVATFLTNQGTDAHLAPGEIGELRDGAGYRVDGVVAAEPETRRGGHVFFDLRARGDEGGDEADVSTVACAAFEPTKRFRDRVRSLRVGDEITAVGEYDAGTLKLEKFALRDPVRTERVNPTCPECGRSMGSAGRDQGFRCRDCGTSAPEKAERELERELEPGWYEVPPCARRHVAKPLVRGGFDAPTHPER